MIHRESRGPVLVLRMEHGKVQALDVELLEALSLELEHPESIRSVVLTGTGRAFSAGVDLYRVLNEGATYVDRFLPLLSSALEKLFAFPRPVVAAINGHAIAGGCILAAACDYRILSREGATIGVPELRVGVPFPASPLEIVRFAVSSQYLQEIVLMGRVWSGEDALRRGLTDELADPNQVLDRAVAVAVDLATIPSDAFSATKKQLRSPVFDRIRQLNDAEIAHLWRSPDTHQVIRDYLQKTIGKK